MHGKLELHFEVRDGATRLRILEQRPPLRVIRGFSLPGAGAPVPGLLVHLHNTSGGILGGDRLEVDVHAGPRTRVQLTSTGATRVYRRAPGAQQAVQTCRLHVSDGALLEYLPDSLIPFRGAFYRQETSVVLGAGAGLFWWETVASGREAGGETFEYERLDLSTHITVGDVPIAIEYRRLEPARHPLTSPARLGPYRFVSTFFVCHTDWARERWLALEAQLMDLAEDRSQPEERTWGVSVLPAHGLVVYGLAVQGRCVAEDLFEFWRTARLALYGEAPVRPRKTA